MYEATQQQRKLERAMRKQKKRILVDEAAGDGEKLQMDQIRLRRISEEYNRFSKAAGLRTQPERTQVAGFGVKQAGAAQRGPLTQNVKTATIKTNALYTNDTDAKKVTMQSIQRIKPFDCDTLSLPLQRKLSNEHKKMLMGVLGKKTDIIEAGRAYRLDMTPLCEMQYSVPGVASVRLPDFDEPYILIHSHPDGRTFSPQDIVAFLNRSDLKMLTAVGNDGAVYAVEKTGAYNSDKLWVLMRKMLVDVSDILQLNKSDSERADMIADRMIPFFEEAKKHGIAYFSTRN